MPFGIMGKLFNDLLSEFSSDLLSAVGSWGRWCGLFAIL